ncbi:MAG TPA: hypothetical protein VFF73_01015 [Planctomycetota bacterium]|nr:hypothetical protein [Planctomycetota bacterium]
MVETTALIVIRTSWWDPQRPPSVQVVRAPLLDGRIVELDLALDLRTVDHIELRPVRRPLLDVAGHVRDAERLANDPNDERKAA